MDPMEAARRDEDDELIEDPVADPPGPVPEWVGVQTELDLHAVPDTDEILREDPEEFEEGEEESEEGVEEAGQGKKRRRGLSAWVGSRARKVASKFYESRAADLEERARRAVGSAYRDSADDIQGRAVRAMREAIAQESERIKEAIEHSVHVKKREMRMSLLVLVTASVLYLLLYWLTHRGAPGP